MWLISESTSHMEKLLKCLQELFKWAVMKIKPSKSPSLSIIKGRCQDAIDDNVIPTIHEKVSKASVAAIPFDFVIVIGGKIF